MHDADIGDIGQSTNQSFPDTFSTKPVTDIERKELMSIELSDIIKKDKFVYLHVCVAGRDLFLSISVWNCACFLALKHKQLFPLTFRAESE